MIETAMDIRERVAAGLRGLKRKPDALVFVDDLVDWTWDEPTVCDIPVFHAAGFLPPSHGRTAVDCLFFPVWADDYQGIVIDTERFICGYCDE